MIALPIDAGVGAIAKGQAMASANINWVAVVAAAFVAYVIGAIWYSPFLFAKPWARLINMPPDQMSGAPLALIVQAVITVITSAVLAVIVGWSAADNPLDGAGVGLLCGGGLVAADHAKLLVFERRAPALFAINNAYTVIAFMIMGAILGIWH
jgi:hypothetical protein